MIVKWKVSFFEKKNQNFYPVNCNKTEAFNLKLFKVFANSFIMLVMKLEAPRRKPY